MPYSWDLEKRIDAAAAEWRGVTKKKMFGGVAHLLNGNLVCGVYKNSLILRMGPDAAEKVLLDYPANPFDITGRPMKGWVMIDETEINEEAFHKLIEKARSFVAGLPAK
jgi:hypothetical protein